MIASTQNTATTGKSLALAVLLAALVASLMLAAKPATPRPASDGKARKNLSNNGICTSDESPAFSPDGKKVAYSSLGKQASNPEGDLEIYRVNTFNGSGKKNLTNIRGVEDASPVFFPEGTKIAYESQGVQTLNPEGDWEVFRMSASDGKDKKNLTDNGLDLTDEHPSGAGNGHIERSP
jgi:Tol biopolymer transport system component